MGGEPTFVSIDDMDGAEWNIAALGDHKRKLAGDLYRRLWKQFAPGGVLHHGQGKWYPGEPLPRWALHCYWRKDGEPVWQDEKLLADPVSAGKADARTAEKFAADPGEKAGYCPGQCRTRLRGRVVLPLEGRHVAGKPGCLKQQA